MLRGQARLGLRRLAVRARRIPPVPGDSLAVEKVADAWPPGRYSSAVAPPQAQRRGDPRAELQGPVRVVGIGAGVPDGD